jgi:hypothetical protein
MKPWWLQGIAALMDTIQQRGYATMSKRPGGFKAEVI